MRHVSTKLLIFWTSFAVCILAMLFWQSQKNRTATVDSGRRQVMGTIARILAVDADEARASEAVEAAFAEIRRIDALMTDYDPQSPLSKLNQTAFKDPVIVDSDIFTVLAAAKRFSEQSEGAFDVTIGPVTHLWRKAKANQTKPNETELTRAKSLVGHENLLLDFDKRTVKFAKPGMLLDLGGIAKGYAIDKAVEILEAAGLSGGMVDIGGDIRCFGTPQNKSAHWLIGLQDPVKQADILMVLKTDDRAVATSGDYQRFVIIDGQKHSHIMNPQTADSAQTLSSVTIIAQTAMTADALATAVTVLGPEKGMDLIEIIPDVETFIIPAGENQKIQKSSGAGQYIKESK